MDETCAIAGGLKTTIKPKYTGTIGYMAQYRESHYSFLRRVACQFNEWLFYDGEQLYFGEPSNKPTISLHYGVDVSNVQMSLRMRPVKYDAFSYHSLRDEQITGNTQNSVSGLDELGMHAFNASKETFNFSPRITAQPRIPDKGSLDDVLKNLQAASAANLSMISGSSTKQDLKIGSVADFKVNIKDAAATNTKPIGRYLITSITHQATGEDGYTNYFEGVPADIKVLPEPSIPTPIAHPQMAIVLSNEDPDKKGRVQVQFQWQIIEGLNTNWIRVMTPDAGVSGNVPQNRGFVCIPERGDQVMIGFRYGDPARPFVMGSMFHGMSGAGGDTNNKMKSITTRTGSTITFDDDTGAGKITISEPSGNTVVMNGDGTMEITAPNQLDINSTLININASDTINVQAGMNINESAGMFDLVAKKKVDIGGKKIDVKAKSKATIKGKKVEVR